MKSGVDSAPELVGVRGTSGIADEPKATKGSLGARSSALQLGIETAGVTGRHGYRRRVVPVERRGGRSAGGGRAEPGEFVADSSGDGEERVIREGVGRRRRSRSNAAEHEGVVVEFQCELEEVLVVNEVV